MSPRLPRHWVVLVGLTLLLAAVYLASMATVKVTNDVQTTSLMSWRIAQTGAPWFDGFDYSRWEGDNFTLWFGEAANGHVVGFRSPGPVAAGVAGLRRPRAWWVPTPTPGCRGRSWRSC